MTERKIALVTASTLPRPDDDMPPLLSALHGKGVTAHAHAWDDPGVDWRGYDRVVLRSTWNYIHHLDAFLQWVDRVDPLTALDNPRDVIHWNAHKRYLVEMSAAGLPVVPTTVVARGERLDLSGIFPRSPELVIKPAVSAGSFATIRVGRAEVARGQAHLDEHRGARDMLVQPFLPSVATAGERAHVFLAGTLSHVMVKQARFAGDRQSVARLPAPDPEEAEVAARVVAWVRQRFARDLLYARVDLARDAAGQPVLMELELIEPALFLREYPAALRRFATALCGAAGHRLRAGSRPSRSHRGVR